MAFNKAARRQKIRYKIRKKISGTKDRPRLSVFRSNKCIYAQLIDDDGGHTLVAASSKDLSETSKKTDTAKAVGKLIAERALSLGVSTIVFDRSGYLYHGRVKSLADGARDAGLKF